MTDVTRVSQFPLKVIFAVHFGLVTWGIQAWLVPSMYFYNTLFLITLMWAVHSSESDEPIQFALLINITSIFFDIIGLSLGSPFSGLSYARFGAGLMVINMLFRLVTSVCLLRIGQARGGTLNTIFIENSTGAPGRQNYEDISQPVPQNSDFVGI